MVDIFVGFKKVPLEDKRHMRNRRTAIAIKMHFLMFARISCCSTSQKMQVLFVLFIFPYILISPKYKTIN